MTDTKTQLDSDALQDLRTQLSDGGHAIIIVDAGLMKFAKFAACLLGLFALIGVIFFGFDVKKAAGEVATANKQISEAQRKLDQTRDVVSREKDALDGLMTEAGEMLRRLEQQEARATQIADQSLEQTMSTFADYVRSTAPSVGDAVSEEDTASKVEAEKLKTALGNFYNSNIEFAKAVNLPAVEVGMLGRHALLEWEIGNVSTAEDKFEAAIRLALAHQRYDLAAEIQMRYADLIKKSFFTDRSPATVKARRRYEDAIDSFKETGNLKGTALALDSVAQTYQLDLDFDRALKTLAEARAIHRQLKEVSYDELTVINRMADIEEEVGRISTAKRLITESISIAEDLDDFDFAANGYLRLARLTNQPSNRTTMLCLAWESLQQQDNRSARQVERFRKKAQRMQEDFTTSKCEAL